MKGMHTKKRRNISSFLKRRRVILLSLGGALLVSGGFIGWYMVSTSNRIAKEQTELTATIRTLNKQIAVAKEKRAAEEKAKKDAADKAAAAQAAEQSKTSGEAGASTIDAKACNAAKTHNNPASIDVVVNKKHCMQPLTYAPSDLVTTNGATLSARAADAYNQLFAAAAAAGQGFYVTSSYRSYADQVSTYNYWVSVSGQAGADTYSARPGYSEHQTGLAFDVAANGCVLDCFGSTSQYQWLQQHAAEYGFIQRYYVGFENVTGYKAEEWHYRYVGVAVAQDMKAKNIKTLEQYWNVTGGDY
jgi:D-alanyl-D-alanine carboxypeptidase